MVKRDVLERKLYQIEKSLRKIQVYTSLNYDEFISHPVARDVVEYNLFIIINCMIDIVNHIVADEELGEIDMLSDGFRILSDYGYWTRMQGAIYIKMVAFRNMIAHQYVDIDANVVYMILQEKLKDIGTFKQQIIDRI
ncbi:Uncharacterized conserved protein YutE, UPF0331/DUF86 family [Pelosinus fermentans]|jgi:uncharacterized protein YutE (UPF0331/DUF86 family)|uniref:type VII toxin-antitoxin system HepT family RNase toxin n=1 Tax=Pelosinus fermentans TaxID=365349 RepID=UPI0002685DB3|nr:DUF86 domain-containing protein [Pelosinus fermentans]OAM92812.1 protein of unknown function DUF86 [Pelosinus fermentans DSM 17108]SDQ57655.1 Uncharacterized conserved protein YutE, UPF0331/DUF86 family [Pelosinus fermentans]